MLALIEAVARVFLIFIFIVVNVYSLPGKFCDCLNNSIIYSFTKWQCYFLFENFEFGFVSCRRKMSKYETKIRVLNAINVFLLQRADMSGGCLRRATAINYTRKEGKRAWKWEKTGAKFARVW